MPIRVGESGKPFRYWMGFDMSGNTELELVFTAPGGSKTTVNTGSSPAVVLGSSAVFDPDVGETLPKNEYMVYEFPTSLFSSAGGWKVQGTYTDTGENPDDIFIGPNVRFKVEAVA